MHKATLKNNKCCSHLDYVLRLANLNEHELFLICRTSNPHQPTLESRVAFQFELDGNNVGFYSGSMKNRITLEWLRDIVVQSDSESRRVLDIGCAYGNMMLMLNAMLGKDQSIEFYGVDLHDEGVAYGAAFARTVAGYENCHYSVQDLSVGINFANGFFTAIYIGDVLEHMDDPGATLEELKRMLAPGGVIIVSTPILDSLFKRIARFANMFSGGKLFKEYYKGKNTDLDENGKPMMITHVGNDHVSELPAKELFTLFSSRNLEVIKFKSMSVNSGSLWFDRHLFLMSFVFLLEAIHERLQIRNWGHSVMVMLKPRC